MIHWIIRLGRLAAMCIYGKCWASYLALEQLLGQLDEVEAAASSRAAAVRCANSLEAAYDESLGFIPAVLENNNQSAIIPAAEALVYPWQMGLKDAVDEEGPFGGYIRMLKRHLRNILNPEMCLYEDGGWKLSSSADNSWMSKISISQFVVREILGMSYEGRSERMRRMYLGRSRAQSFMPVPISLVLVSLLVASTIHELSLTSYGWIRMQ